MPEDEGEMSREPEVEKLRKDYEGAKDRCAELEREKEALRGELAAERKNLGKIARQNHATALFGHVNPFLASELKLGRLLGRGTFGCVYLASTVFYRKVAVKMYNNEGQPLPPTRSTHDSPDKGSLEIGNLIKVGHHPHFVQVRGVVYKTEMNFPIGYMMEHMHGGTLYEVIHGKPNGEPIGYEYLHLLDWTRQISSALCYMHNKRITHRDIKPDNILVDVTRRVLKLCDLGCSGTTEEGSQDLLGTYTYMAPELMVSHSQNTLFYPPAVDVYSLIITVWEIYHRRDPFPNLNCFCMDAINEIRGGERPIISHDCPKPLKTVIRRGWSSVASERPSMEEIHTFTVDELKEFEETSTEN